MFLCRYFYKRPGGKRHKSLYCTSVERYRLLKPTGHPVSRSKSLVSSQSVRDLNGVFLFFTRTGIGVVVPDDFVGK